MQRVKTELHDSIFSFQFLHFTFSILYLAFIFLNLMTLPIVGKKEGKFAITITLRTA